jgi:hypothetical protein
MQDATLKLFPATAGTGTISAAGTVAQTGKFLGKNRSFNMVARSAGTITAGATLAFTIQETSDLTGATGWADVPGTGQTTVPQMVGYQTGGGTARYEVPGTLAVRATFSTTKDMVRVSTITGGTTPTITGISIYAEPIANPTVPSGR